MAFNALRLIIVLVLTLSIPSFAQEDETRPILIGATVSLEGKYSEPSFMVRKAFRLWEQEVNDSGGLLGRPVKLILYDDKSQKELVRKLYAKLIEQDKVDLVFSPYGTPLTLLASEVSEQKKMVMLACAASGEKIWERGYKYVFGVYALANRYYIGFLDLMAREGFETVAIIYENSPFHIDVAKGTESWSKRFGLRIAYKQSFTDAKPELPKLLKEAIKVNADGLIISAYPPDGYRSLNLIKKVNYKPKALGLSIIPTHPDFYRQAGQFAEGVFGPSQWEPDERIPFPGTQNFIEKFSTYASKIPSYHAGSAYAACQLMARAVSKTNSLDHNKIRDHIRSLDTVTVIGRFKVSHAGKQVGHNPILVQWQNKKKEIVYPTKMQTRPPRF